MSEIVYIECPFCGQTRVEHNTGAKTSYIVICDCGHKYLVQIDGSEVKTTRLSDEQR